jgi:hypothetical protein
VDIALSIAIVIAASAAAIGGMLLLRRRAPEGGYFSDAERAAGVFGVLATAFSVLLAFVIFLTFSDFDDAKSAAEDESLAVSEQFEAAELFAPAERDLLQGELICYGRAVIEDEWPLLGDGERSELVDGWVASIDRSFDAASPGAFAERAAFEKWFDETATREKARGTRLVEADGVIPTPLWLVLLLGAASVIGYMFMFADSRELRRAQAVQIGAVTALVTASLLVVNFLDQPYEGRTGSIEPEAMRFALQRMVDEEANRHELATPPCDDHGARLAP